MISARTVAREGNTLYNNADYRGAIEKYKEAVQLDPKTPNVYVNMGYAYFSIFDPESQDAMERDAAREAVKAFEAHLKIRKKDENARIFLIKILLKAAPYEKDLADQALQTFLEMLKKNPADKEARQYLITLFIDCRRYLDAVQFFQKELDAKPNDIEIMKILAIIADKSNETQAAVDWYWKRAETTEDPEKKAVLLYEVGTYVWNLIHYQPDRVTGVDAIRLIDQGIEATMKAMELKDKYAEAMVYVNLLYLKRALFETEDVARAWDNQIAFEYRKEAGLILMERKKHEEQNKAASGDNPQAPKENSESEKPKG